MKRRNIFLLARILLTIVGAAAIGVAALASSQAALLAGFGALASAEFVGLGLIVAKLESPAERTLLGTAEALPAMAVSFLEPFAMVVALVQVSYATISSGIATVSSSAGKPLSQPRSEVMRRILAFAANAGLGLILLHAAGHLSLEATLEVSSRDLALLCAAMAFVGATRTVTELAMGAKWSKL